MHRARHLHPNGACSTPKLLTPSASRYRLNRSATAGSGVILSPIARPLGRPLWRTLVASTAAPQPLADAVCAQVKPRSAIAAELPAMLLPVAPAKLRGLFSARSKEGEQEAPRGSRYASHGRQFTSLMDDWYTRSL
jgi:hypothetical protein